MTDDEVDQLLGDALRSPRSLRGLDVEATCQILSEAVKARVPGQYADVMRRVEQRYVEAFLQTATVRPGFAERIRRAITLYI